MRPGRPLEGLGLAAAVALAGVAFAVALGAGKAQEPGPYTITIENLTSGQPLTPPLLVTHAPTLNLFEVGSAASPGLQALAENGDARPLTNALRTLQGVTSIVMASAPVLPGESVTLVIEAGEDDMLSWVSGLVCTNDGFTGVDSESLNEDLSVDTGAYDAGTEINTEDFADLPSACRELGGASEPSTDRSDPALAEDAVIDDHAGIQGIAELTQDHAWNGAVASITISAGDSGLSQGGPGDGAATRIGGPPTFTPPATGETGLAGSDTGPQRHLAAALLGLIVLTGAYLRRIA